MRVALLHHTYAGGAPAELARALGDATVITSHPRPRREAVEDGVRVVRVPRLPEFPLRYRGFTGPLTQAPAVWRELRGYDVVQALTPEDAAIALRARERGGPPVVFTPIEPLTRDRVADRRLRLRVVTDAVERSDALTAPTKESAGALRRWFAIDAPLIAPSDGAGHVALFERLLGAQT